MPAFADFIEVRSFTLGNHNSRRLPLRNISLKTTATSLASFKCDSALPTRAFQNIYGLNIAERI